MTKMIKCKRCRKIFPRDQGYVENNLYRKNSGIFGWGYKGWDICKECAEELAQKLSKPGEELKCGEELK